MKAVTLALRVVLAAAVVAWLTPFAFFELEFWQTPAMATGVFAIALLLTMRWAGMVRAAKKKATGGPAFSG